MKITVISPVLNENPWIGYSIMAALPYVEQFVYALDQKSNDGTRDLLQHVKEKYAKERLIILDHPTFHPHDMNAYNAAFNSCIAKASTDAAMFLHPDMIITEFGKPDYHALAWWTNITSYAGDFRTKISKGRATKWKNIHAKKFKLHYYGGYGSQNEDFYHADITGNAYKHYGEDFLNYPYQVADSGIKINHYCELKDYDRRLEKMKLCLKTQDPTLKPAKIHEMAINHPRVTLKTENKQF